ncbi:AAA family ATPase, partial [Mycolicibacterium sp. CR10]|uniref:AAA family ATPase n=1 Tax=Mycolicibacterium sp. CR10 TaxID=2562314 RepID=UPI001484D411
MTGSEDTRTFLQRVDDWKAAQQQPEDGHHPVAVGISHADAYVAAAQRNELQELHGCGQGKRNDTLNRVALKLGRLPIDRDTLKDELVAACHANGLIRDDGHSSVEATIRSAFTKADLDGPRILPARVEANGAVPGSGNEGREPGTAIVPGSRNRTGTEGVVSLTAVPGSRPTMREPGTADEKPLYVDICALLAGTMPEPPEPQLGRRTDGHCLFYAGQVNWLFGDPESGKSWLCMACVVESLQAGRRVLIIDLDHNGASATVRRLSDMGAPHDALSNPNLFRYCEPEDRTELRQVIDDSMQWKPAVAIVDSIGELLPMYGASSNSSDDFTLAHSNVLKPLARAGAAVIAVDHLAKNADSRAVGPGCVSSSDLAPPSSRILAPAGLGGSFG